MVTTQPIIFDITEEQYAKIAEYSGHVADTEEIKKNCISAIEYITNPGMIVIVKKEESKLKLYLKGCSQKIKGEIERILE